MKRFCRPREGIPSDQLSAVYHLVEQAIQNTDVDGKTTDEIFGEIYTRFRSDACIYGAHDKLRPLFNGRLKHLNGTEAGEKLNDIINELFLEEAKNESSIMELELCTTIMHDCVLDAKEVSAESERVMSHLEQIDCDLNGGM